MKVPKFGAVIALSSMSILVLGCRELDPTNDMLEVFDSGLTNSFDPAACEQGRHTPNNLQNKTWSTSCEMNGERVGFSLLFRENDSVNLSKRCPNGRTIEVTTNYTLTGDTIRITHTTECSLENEDGTVCRVRLAAATFLFGVHSLIDDFGERLYLCNQTAENVTFH